MMSTAILLCSVTAQRKVISNIENEQFMYKKWYQKLLHGCHFGRC